MNAIVSNRRSFSCGKGKIQALTSTLDSGDLPSKLERVEALMREVARGARIDRAGSMALEQLAARGKRLRARLALLACEAFSVPEEWSVPWAAAVEILHNATLVHDDIQDGDHTRRGEATLWTKHGVSQAINAGDLLLMLPFLVVAPLPPFEAATVSRLLADYATRIVRGQVEELDLLPSDRLDFESYAHAAAGKTGGLLALPVVGAATLARCPSEHTRALGEVFTQLGVLFQLQDDVVDLFGDKGRGVVGCDVYEGKVSALAVAHLARAPESEEALLEILARPRAQTTPEDVQRVRQFFLESGALDDVLNHILELERTILDSPALTARPSLASVAEELIVRSLEPIDHLLRLAREAAQ